MITRRILLGMLSIPLLLIGWVAISFGITRFNEARALAAIQATGAPISVAEIIDALPPASSADAAAHLGKVSGSALDLFNELRPDLFPDDSTFDWRTPLDKKQRARIEAIYGKYPDVMTAWQTATNSNYYRWPVKSKVFRVFNQELFDSLDDVRLFSRIAICRAEYLATTGRPDEAVEVCLSQFRLLDLQDSGYGVVTFLVTTACRSEMVRTLNSILQTQDVTDESHAAIERVLAIQDALPGFLNGIQTERVIGIESLRQLPFPLSWLGGDLMGYLEFMQAEEDAGTKSQWKFPNANPVALSGIAMTALPAMESARQAMNRLRGEMRCLRVLNAIQQRELDVKGLSESGSLEGSNLPLPPDATIDPFNGQPIQIQVNNGLVIYCVGTNLVDDGGDVQGETDFGIAAVP